MAVVAAWMDKEGAGEGTCHCQHIVHFRDTVELEQEHFARQQASAVALPHSDAACVEIYTLPDQNVDHEHS